MKGQALVELALVTPLILILILGGAGVGFLLLERMVLTHTAQEVAIWAAQNECAGALGRVPQILGHEPDVKTCDVQGQMVEVFLRDAAPIVVPLVPLPTSVEVSARALIRDSPAPSPSASP